MEKENVSRNYSMKKILFFTFLPGVFLLVLLYGLREPIINFTGLPNFYVIQLSIGLMFLFQLSIFLIVLYTEGVLFSKEKLLKFYPYLNFTWKSINLKQWIYIISLSIVVIGGTYIFIGPINSWIENNLITPPNWYPISMSSNLGVEIDLTFAIVMTFVLILNVVIEEVYFKVFLLEKMRWMGKKDWIINGLLFTVYHISQPWGWLGILPGGLLASYATKYTKSVWFAVVGHFIGNLIGIISFWVLAV